MNFRRLQGFALLVALVACLPLAWTGCNQASAVDSEMVKKYRSDFSLDEEPDGALAVVEIREQLLGESTDVHDHDAHDHDAHDHDAHDHEADDHDAHGDEGQEHAHHEEGEAGDEHGDHEHGDDHGDHDHSADLPDDEEDDEVEDETAHLEHEHADEEQGHEEQGHEEQGHDEQGHEEQGHDEHGHDEHAAHKEDGHDESARHDTGHAEHKEDGHDESAHHDEEHAGHDHAAHGPASSEPIDVVMVGLVGGLPNAAKETQPDFPFVNGYAIIMVADPQAVAELEDSGHNHAPGEECAFCASHAGDSSALLATVKFTDENGKVLSVDARKLFDLKEKETVVVRGKARLDQDGTLVVDATGLYVRR